MTNYDIELGQGDSDSVTKTLNDANGAATLTGATVIFNMKSIDGSTEYNITCTVNSPTTSGIVTIPFTDTETAVAGRFFGEFKVTISGNQYTFPSGTYLTIYIKEAL